MTSVSADVLSPASAPAASPAVVLTIAGSEATGGAGAQADLKTFQELGVFGIANLTCIVSFDPNDNWNPRFVPIDQQVIADQLEATTAAYGPAAAAPSVPGRPVLDRSVLDRPVLDTVKIGMLGSQATIGTVAAALVAGRFRHVVLDPVLICKGQESGHALDTDQALKARILPLATFVTPNHFETESLSGLVITDLQSLKAAAVRIHELSGAAVLAKGGVRLEGTDAVDVYYDGETIEVLSSPKVGEVAVSGAGCSLAAAVTAELAKGATPLEAARTAKEFVTAGIRNRVLPRARRLTHCGRAATARLPYCIICQTLASLVRAR
jgi:pyridoxine kinase